MIARSKGLGTPYLLGYWILMVSGRGRAQHRDTRESHFLCQPEQVPIITLGVIRFEDSLPWKNNKECALPSQVWGKTAIRKKKIAQARKSVSRTCEGQYLLSSSLPHQVLLQAVIFVGWNKTTSQGPRKCAVQQLRSHVPHHPGRPAIWKPDKGVELTFQAGQGGRWPQLRTPQRWVRKGTDLQNSPGCQARQAPLPHTSHFQIRISQNFTTWGTPTCVIRSDQL
jgi:hypothetical protein